MPQISCADSPTVPDRMSNAVPFQSRDLQPSAPMAPSLLGQVKAKLCSLQHFLMWRCSDCCKIQKCPLSQAVWALGAQLGSGLVHPLTGRALIP